MKFEPRFRTLALALLASASLPAVAVAQTLTVTDISVSGPGSTVSIPTIEVTDSSLDQAAIRGLFSGTLEAAADVIGSFDAAKVVIPELTITVNPPAGEGGAVAVEPVVTRYSNLELTNVVDGIAQSARVGGADVSGGAPDTVMTMGAMSSGLVDFGGILGFYGLGPDAAGTAMKPLYRDFRIDGISFGGTGFSCELGALTAAEFSSRPLKGTFAEVMAWTQEIEAAEKAGTKPSSETIASLIAYYADMFTAFESAPSYIDGLVCSGTDPEGGAVKINAGTMTIGAFTPGIYPEVALAGLRVEVGTEGWVEFDDFTWKKTDLNGPLAAVTAPGVTIDEAWLAANWRKLIPALDGFSLTGFAMDVPDPENAGGRIAASVGTFDVSLADYVNGIPSTIATSGTDIAVTVPTDADGAALRALGIETLNLDYDLAASWDEATKTITVERLAFAGDDLGSVSISGTIANAGPELFNDDANVAMAASMGLTVTSLTIDITNGGITPLLIASAAAEQGQAPEAFQVAAAGMAQAMPLALLGGTPDALAVSQALGQFLNGAPNLSITLTSVDPAGIGLAELMAAESDPTVLKDKVTVAAAASGEPVPFTYPEITAPAPVTPKTEPAPETAPPAQPETSRQGEKESTKN